MQPSTEICPATDFAEAGLPRNAGHPFGTIVNEACLAAQLFHRSGADLPNWTEDAEVANSLRIAIQSAGRPAIATIRPSPSDPWPARRRRAALPKWRLRRAVDYIEAHLDGTVTLAALAKAVGLTAMHFAAQFRAATGIRPHEYLLRRRIARAQELLHAPNARLVEVALDVGFQTQAHFTTVFKRFTGTTPHQWRLRNYQPIERANPRRDPWSHAPAERGQAGAWA